MRLTNVEIIDYGCGGAVQHWEAPYRFRVILNFKLDKVRGERNPCGAAYSNYKLIAFIRAWMDARKSAANLLKKTQ